MAVWLIRSGRHGGGEIFLWLLLLLGPAAARAISVGTGGTGLWNQAENWMPEGIHGAGADVFLGTEAVVYVDAATASLGTLEVSGGRVIVTNWTATITAIHIIVASGEIGAAGPYTNGGAPNCIWIVCSNLGMKPGGRIMADACGYAGGYTLDTTTYAGHAPNEGQPQGDGASDGGHGGRGGPGYGIGRFTDSYLLSKGTLMPYRSAVWRCHEDYRRVP